MVCLSILISCYVMTKNCIKGYYIHLYAIIYFANILFAIFGGVNKAMNGFDFSYFM